MNVYVCLCVCLCMSLFVCLWLYVSVRLSVCLYFLSETKKHLTVSVVDPSTETVTSLLLVWWPLALKNRLVNY